MRQKKLFFYNRIELANRMLAVQPLPKGAVEIYWEEKAKSMSEGGRMSLSEYNDYLKYFKKVIISINPEGSLLRYPIEHITSRGRSVYVYTAINGNPRIDEIAAGDEVLCPWTKIDGLKTELIHVRKAKDMCKEDGVDTLVLLYWAKMKSVGILMYKEEGLYQEERKTG